MTPILTRIERYKRALIDDMIHDLIRIDKNKYQKFKDMTLSAPLRDIQSAELDLVLYTLDNYLKEAYEENDDWPPQPHRIYDMPVEDRIKELKYNMMARDYEGMTTVLTSDIHEILQYIEKLKINQMDQKNETNRSEK